MRPGDTVRLRPGSRLAPLLGRMASALGRVSHTCQIDDDGLQISITFAEPEEAYTSLLPAEEFERVALSTTADGCDPLPGSVGSIAPSGSRR